MEGDKQSLFWIFRIERDTNNLHGEAKAASVKVDVRPCSRKRGYSCFPVVLRLCFFWFCEYIQKEIEKTISQEAKVFLPVGKGVGKDGKFLAK